MKILGFIRGVATFLFFMCYAVIGAVLFLGLCAIACTKKRQEFPEVDMVAAGDVPLTENNIGVTSEDCSKPLL